VDAARVTQHTVHVSTTRVCYHALQDEVAAYELGISCHASCKFFLTSEREATNAHLKEALAPATR
jgi:hypothetical protein